MHLDWLILSESFSVLPHATFLFITHKSSPPPALKNCLLSVCNHLSKAEKKGWYELKQRCLAQWTRIFMISNYYKMRWFISEKINVVCTKAKVGFIYILDSLNSSYVLSTKIGLHRIDFINKTYANVAAVIHLTRTTAKAQRKRR